MWSGIVVRVEDCGKLDPGIVPRPQTTVLTQKRAPTGARHGSGSPQGFFMMSTVLQRCVGGTRYRALKPWFN